MKENSSVQAAETAPSSEKPVADIRRIYAGLLAWEEAINAFRNMDSMFPTNTVARSSKPIPLAVEKADLRHLHFQSNGSDYSLRDYLSLNHVTGLLILKDGRVAVEEYLHGNNERTRWMSMSVAKSISTTLVGAAIQDGFISSVEAPLTDYLPELRGSGYDHVSIRHLLQMTSGVRWDDSPTDPSSERRRMLELQIAQQPGSIMRYMASLPSVAKPGSVFNYSTGETHVVGALVQAATGRTVSDYLSEKIWSRIGTEADAAWWLDAPGGLEVAGSGMSATLRDYGRFGQFILDDGVVDGQRILPQGWVQESGACREINGEMLEYGYMWWPVPVAGRHDGAFSARGLFGQYIYINPQERVVIVVWSARPKPLHSEVVADNDFFNAAVAALR